MNEQFNREINNFIKTINPFWNKDLKIRYVYRNLASFFQRDLSFFMADEDVQFQQYLQGFAMNGKEVVCITICKYYKMVFKRLHIDSKIVVTNTKKIPHFAILVNGNNGWFLIDPLKDLMVNQLGIDTSFFGIVPKYGLISLIPCLIGLDSNYVKSLDNQLNQSNLTDLFWHLHLEISSSSSILKFYKEEKTSPLSSIFCKIRFMNEYLLNLGFISGTYERMQYYDYLIQCLFNKRERRNLASRINENLELELLIDYHRRGEQDIFILYREMENENQQYVLRRVDEK